MNLETFSALTLRWQQLALDVAPQRFRALALQALEPHFSFSAAWWGVDRWPADKAAVLNGYLHHLPDSFLSDWWRVAQQDLLAHRALQAPGTTVMENGDEPWGQDSQDIADLGAQYGLAYALTTALPMERNDLGSFVSLYRGRHLPPFSIAEQWLVEQLMRHLLQAEQLNWRISLGSTLPACPAHLALANGQGRLETASPEFCATLLLEFPDWTGETLPVALMNLFSGSGGQWKGRNINMVLKHEAGSVAAPWQVQLQQRIGEGLTPREEQVARAYASGLSYKEIARSCGLSPATVRGYLRECYEKLSVSNKSELSSRLGQAPALGRH